MINMFMVSSGTGAAGVNIANPALLRHAAPDRGHNGRDPALAWVDYTYICLIW
jgi:hypothetical protein